MLKPNHFTINVRDVEKSLDFYGRILGLKRLEDVDMGDHVLYYFDLSDGVSLELIEYRDDFGEAQPGVKERGIYRHMALQCDDVDALYRHLVENGVKCLTEPADVPQLHFRNILVEDPNGVEIEFIRFH